MRILLIEDETVIGDMIAMYLTDEGYTVKRVYNGFAGLAAVDSFHPDMALIDYVLPDINGIEVCKEIRKSSFMPILMVSMITEVSNRVEALLAGADDYLCKPFSMKELVARMVAQLRRYHQVQRHEPAVNEEMVNEFIRIDHEFRTIKVNGNEVEMTFSEFEIMKLLSNAPGRVFSREELITYLRGDTTMVNERSIDVHVTKLRNKIEKDPKNPQYIKTVWGIGYKYVITKDEHKTIKKL